MPILLFDAGNTRLKYAVTEAASSSSYLEKGVVEYASLEQGLQSVLNRHVTNRVLISSVASGEINEAIAKLLLRHHVSTASYAKVSNEACGIVNTYETQHSLGVDRWVAAMGVAQLRTVNRVIVDVGTAVTVDLVDASNSYLGGVILPGARLMHDVLVGKTAGIQSERSDVGRAIGKTTQQCVNAGSKYGLIGAVERVIKEFQRETANEAEWSIHVCGGDGAWLSQLIETDAKVTLDSDVIFNGLMNLYSGGFLK